MIYCGIHNVSNMHVHISLYVYGYRYRNIQNMHVTYILWIPHYLIQNKIDEHMYCVRVCVWVRSCMCVHTYSTNLWGVSNVKRLLCNGHIISCCFLLFLSLSKHDSILSSTTTHIISKKNHSMNIALEPTAIECLSSKHCPIYIKKNAANFVSWDTRNHMAFILN